MAAWCFVWRKVSGWTQNRETEATEAARLARRAVALGPDDAVALTGGGYTLAFVAHELEVGASYIEKAIAVNPNLAAAWHASGWTKAFLGETDEAISRLNHTMRLSPLDPFTFRALGGIAFAHLLAGRYDEACRWAERALEQRPEYLAAIRDLAAAHALGGRLDEAGRAVTRLRSLVPTLRMAYVKEWVPFRYPEHLAVLERGLRLAGLPE